MQSSAQLANLRPWTDEDRAKRRYITSNTHRLAPRAQFSQYILQHTQNGYDLADFFMRVLRGESFPADAVGRARVPRLRERMWAAEWLANRAFGLPKEFVEITDDTSARDARMTLIANMSEEDREALKTILYRAMEQRVTVDAAAANP